MTSVLNSIIEYYCAKRYLGFCTIILLTFTSPLPKCTIILINIHLTIAKAGEKDFRLAVIALTHTLTALLMENSGHHRNTACLYCESEWVLYH